VILKYIVRNSADSMGMRRKSGCPYYVYCSISINIDFDFGMITTENRVYGLLDR